MARESLQDGHVSNDRVASFGCASRELLNSWITMNDTCYTGRWYTYPSENISQLG